MKFSWNCKKFPFPIPNKGLALNAFKALIQATIRPMLLGSILPDRRYSKDFLTVKLSGIKFQIIRKNIKRKNGTEVKIKTLISGEYLELITNMTEIQKKVRTMPKRAILVPVHNITKKVNIEITNKSKVFRFSLNMLYDIQIDHITTNKTPYAVALCMGPLILSW
jgi:hypothetical protein